MTSSPVPSGGGRPLGAEVRGFMEQRFGRNFADVRVHTGPAAEQSAERLGARAYTVGRDIVFNRGEYQPRAEAGRHLLAHELAHTVQQAGVQRKSDAVSSASESQLEVEADRAADAVMSGHSTPAITPVGASGILRAAKGKDPDFRKGKWQQLPTNAIASHATDPDNATPSKATRVFKMIGPFELPGEKGSAAKKLWDEKAAAGGLETVWDSTNKQVAIYQKRDASQLRNFWLEKVGWTQANAAQQWHALRPANSSNKWPATPAPAASSGFVPSAAGETCDMDHVVELQVQGTNVASNIAVLDPGANRSSGGQIRGYIESLGTQLEKLDPTKSRYLVLHWSTVKQGPTQVTDKTPCAELESAAIAGLKGGLGGTPDSKESRYWLRAGGATAWADVPKTQPANEAPLSIEDTHAKQLVPGLSLLTLSRTTKPHQVAADFDERSSTRVPLHLKKVGAILLTVSNADGELKIKDTTAKDALGVHYPYLSEGTITKLEQTSAGISGEAVLVPSIPLLSKMRLQLRFGPDRLELIGGFDPSKMHLPIPGFKITRAEAALLLHPTFTPSGTVEFEVTPSGKRKVLQGKLLLGSDGLGFFARGELQAFLPGVDDARGELTYRKSGWSGSLHVDASKFRLPVPGMNVKSGSLDLRLIERGIEADGRLVVGLPRDQEAELGLKYKGGRWLFEGSGTFRVAPLKDFIANVSYDGENLDAKGTSSLEYRGFVANVSVHYRNGKVSGKGRLDFEKGRAKGHADVEVDDALRLSGTGLVTIRVGEQLIATAGIELDKNGKTRLLGALTVPKPIVLFKGFGNSANVFALRKTFPIPALSIGPLGVQAVLAGSLDVAYSVGPATLEDTTLALQLDPFADKPDVDIGVKSSLQMPAFAAITATIGGGIELEAGLARAGGQVDVTGGARLSGRASGDVDLRYHQQRIHLKANAGIHGGLALNLGIKASVYGEAGAWKFTKRWSKEWVLYDKTIDTGLRFKLLAPISYDTINGLKLPSMNEIEVEKPQIDLKDLVNRLAASATTKESGST
ncbi:MAG TPA: DUF4157 domain-containing protein [Polyangiaceae bacterium]|nr:DUF4157 domain-containing protein [Polyangiaceae bacterium]